MGLKHKSKVGPFTRSIDDDMTYPMDLRETLVVRSANERGSPLVMELLCSGGGRGYGLHGGHLTTNSQHYLSLGGCVCIYFICREREREREREVDLNITEV